MAKLVEVQPIKCIHCGKKPHIIHYDENMWYVECDCGKHPKYEYLGSTKQVAIDRWEYANRIGNFRKANRKNKDAYKDI